MTKKETLILTIIISAGIAGFFALLLALLSGRISSFDDPVRFWFYELRSPGLSAFVTKFTLLGNWQSITLICMLFLIIRPARMNFGVPLAAGAVFTTALNKVIKMVVARPRPDDILHLISESGFSFSSGHSITSMFFFGLLLWLILRNMKPGSIRTLLTVIMIIMMFGIGLSRIYCGVHYPSDVLSGWCLGISVAAAEILIIRRNENHVVSDSSGSSLYTD